MTDCEYINNFDSVFDGDKLNEKFLEGFIKDCDLIINLVVRTWVSRMFLNGDAEIDLFKNNFNNNLKILKVSDDLKER